MAKRKRTHTKKRPLRRRMVIAYINLLVNEKDMMEAQRILDAIEPPEMTNDFEVYLDRKIEYEDRIVKALTADNIFWVERSSKKRPVYSTKFPHYKSVISLIPQTSEQVEGLKKMFEQIKDKQRIA